MAIYCVYFLSLGVLNLNRQQNLVISKIDTPSYELHIGDGKIQHIEKPGWCTTDDR